MLFNEAANHYPVYGVGDGWPAAVPRADEIIFIIA
jgi:hypothetical protein